MARKRESRRTASRPAHPETVYQLRIDIRDTRPPIWRRLLARDDITLHDLHRAIQFAFGWSDSHLHEFDIEGINFQGPSEFGIDEIDDAEDSRGVLLCMLELYERFKFIYTYDFGDNWRHQIVVEKVLSPLEAAAAMAKALGPDTALPEVMPVAICTAGSRARPPEDCGGAWAYHELCEVLANHQHPEHEERAGQMHFDPERFEPKPVNAQLLACRPTTVRPGFTML